MRWKAPTLSFPTHFELLKTNCKRGWTSVNILDFSKLSVGRPICASQEILLSRIAHNVLRIYPFDTLFAPFESPRRQLLNVAKSVSNGYILRKLCVIIDNTISWLAQICRTTDNSEKSNMFTKVRLRLQVRRPARAICNRRSAGVTAECEPPI